MYIFILFMHFFTRFGEGQRRMTETLFYLSVLDWMEPKNHGWCLWVHFMLRAIEHKDYSDCLVTMSHNSLRNEMID